MGALRGDNLSRGLPLLSSGRASRLFPYPVAASCVYLFTRSISPFSNAFESRLFFSDVVSRSPRGEARGEAKGLDDPLATLLARATMLSTSASDERRERDPGGVCDLLDGGV